MIRYAIFDLDGTLLDSMGTWRQSVNHLLKQEGVCPPEDLEQQLQALSLRGGCEYLSRHLLPRYSGTQVRAALDDLLREEYRLRIPLKQGARQQLERLYCQGTAMVIATAGIPECACQALDRLDIARYFSGMVNCADLGVDKNTPAVYLAAMTLAGAPTPQEAVVLEDAPHAILAAKNAGFPVIGVADAFTREPPKEVRRLCDGYLNTWAELPLVEQLLFPR